MLIFLLPIVAGIVSILAVLCIFEIVGYSWITGFIIAITFGFISFICLRFAIDKIVDDQNVFTFIFLAILRIGMYMVPFLISIYLSNHINPIGVVIGFLIIVIFPVIIKE
ncbi:MG406 family protein [Spiroplasma chinense]